MTRLRALAFGALLAGVAHTAGAGPVLDQIMETGVIRTPVPDIWPPAVVQLPDGTLTGMDVEVMREIARRIGVEVEYVTHPDGSIITWDEQTSGDWGGQYDIVVNSMTPTEERAQYLTFPAIYYYSMAVLAVHKDNTTIRAPADASGMRIGALRGSTLEMYLRQEPFGIVGVPPFQFRIDSPQIIAYDHEQQTVDALVRGDGVELDGYVNYLQQVLALIDQGAPIKVVGQPLFLDPQAIAIQPGDDELAELLRTTVEEMHADGTLSRLSMEWFNFDFTQQ